MSGISDQGMRPSHVEAGGGPEAGDQLKEPSTEKEPGEEPKAPKKNDPEPSHEAVGIGVIGRPQTEPDAVGRTDPDAEDQAEEEKS
ncbi:hypothetical protein ACFVAE_14490 [Microbacterium sp. NPDC057659]|uniref:hypothetical protein n=1 Tax=Microbacterium sp. NPDC057659 TaxID=3346198 RepID=UPI0036721202